MHVLSVLTLASLALAAPATLKRDEPAALLKPKDEAQVIPDKYIIKMKEGADVTVASTTYQAYQSYSSKGFKGFAAKLDKEALEAVRNDPEVEYVEHDQYLSTLEYLSQDNAPWGLARLSNASPGGSSYVFDSSAGEGVCVYVIDTGIRTDLDEFEGRAEWVQNFTDDGHDADGAGHGTFVAGLVASRSYGVAKKARLLALKVFRDDGSTEGSVVLAAMDYVAREKSAGGRPGCPAGYVANMSLGGGFSQASNDAADAIVRAGVFLAVAAGNSNVDAAQTSPASAPLACTVGATDAKDARASFSSYGPVVDVWAPGVSMQSTSYEGGSTTASGTSASSPIVAGLGAYLMALEGLSGGEGVCDRVKELAVRDALSGLPEGSANLLANNGAPRRDNQPLAAAYHAS